MTMTTPLLRAVISRPGQPLLGLRRQLLTSEPAIAPLRQHFSTEDTKRQHRDDHKHCVELVQSRDLDGYLCGLLMPSTAARDAYFAIRAFNVEVASVKDGGGLGRRRPRSEASVSSVDASAFGGGGGGDMGEMDATLASRLRMQWWRDAVAEMYEEKEGGDESSKPFEPSSAGFLSQTYSASRKHNPIVRELTRASEDVNLTRRFLDRMIDAREHDLDVSQYDTMRDLVHYGEATSSSLLYLALECCNVRDGKADEVASRIGASLGIITALRSLVYRANFGEIAIPADIMAKHDVPMQFLLSPPDRFSGAELSPQEKVADEALKLAVREMAHVAGAYLSEARKMQGGVPKDGRAALLPAVGALSYLTKLNAVQYNLFHEDLIAQDGLSSRLGRLGNTFSLTRAWLTGVF